MIDLLDILNVDDWWGDARTKRFNHLYVFGRSLEDYVNHTTDFLKTEDQTTIDEYERRFSVLGEQGKDFILVSISKKLINPNWDYTRVMGWMTVNEDWKMLEKLTFPSDQFNQLQGIVEMTFGRR